MTTILLLLTGYGVYNLLVWYVCLYVIHVIILNQDGHR